MLFSCLAAGGGGTGRSKAKGLSCPGLGALARLCRARPPSASGSARPRCGHPNSLPPCTCTAHSRLECLCLILRPPSSALHISRRDSPPLRLCAICKLTLVLFSSLIPRPPFSSCSHACLPPINVDLPLSPPPPPYNILASHQTTYLVLPLCCVPPPQPLSPFHTQKSIRPLTTLRNFNSL